MFLDSTYKGDDTVFVFLCLPYFIQGPSMLSQMAGFSDPLMDISFWHDGQNKQQ